MAHETAKSMERVTITLPGAMVEEIEARIVADHYSTVSEWIRRAIREQLHRDKSPFQILVEKEPALAASLADSESGAEMTKNIDDLFK